MLKPVRILQSFARLDRGGAETVVMEWMRNIDRSKVNFDFTVNDEHHYDYEDEILALGGRIYRLPVFRGWNVFSYLLQWSRLLKDHPEWGTVHVHHTTPAAFYVPVIRLLGRKALIHSHVAGSETGIVGVIRRALRLPLRFLSTARYGCSQDALQWMFGSRSDCTVIPNAINVDNFIFKNDRRIAIRREFALTDQFVVCHIGRFVPEKNHNRVVSIFKEVHDENPQSHLFLVGDGEGRRDIEQLVARLGLEASVTFLGVRDDIPDILSASDILLFPSLFEGLGVVLVEAQANGLRSVISTAIPNEATLTSLITRIDLKQSDTVWARQVLSPRTHGDRAQFVTEVRQSGYDISIVAEQVFNIYRSTENEDFAHGL